MVFELNSLDLCFIGLIGFSSLISFFKGLVRELSALANWIVAIWFGFLFHQPMASVLFKNIQPLSLRLIVGFFTIFCAGSDHRHYVE
jgi:membrane protein required for colicin V production